MNKVQNRLNGWDALRLSMAGKITLVKFVLLVIPNYFMSIVRVPVTVCNEIEKLARNFIWGATSEARKPALLSWDK